MRFANGTPEAERFWAKVRKEDDGCWIWTAGMVRGYGYFRRSGRNGKQVRAPRWAYEQAKGLIPEGLTIDHLCRNPACVNPDHLEAVTMKENGLRGDTVTSRNARKTTCPRGHAYDRISSQGGRGCRRCRRDWAREYARKRRAEGLRHDVCPRCGGLKRKVAKICRACFTATPQLGEDSDRKLRRIS